MARGSSRTSARSSPPKTTSCWAGRHTTTGSGYWPTSDVEPFASFINGTPKHVFTSSRPAEEWGNSTFVERSATEYVAELKQGDDGDIGIHGSIELSRSLIHAGLVDELRLVVAPALAHTGRKLFNGQSNDKLRELELLESSRTNGGALLLWYRFESGSND